MTKLKIFLLLITINVSIISVAQKRNEAEIDEKLFNLYAEIIKAKDEGNFDSIEIKNNDFKNALLNYLEQDTSSIDYKFNSLGKVLKIIYSDDRQVKIYNWNTWLGGTMHYYQKIIQFRTNKIVKVLFYENMNTEDEDIGWYSNICELKLSNKTTYLAIYNAIYSTILNFQSINALEIENDELIRNIDIFKVNNEFDSSLGIYFDFFSVVERPERPVELIKYDEKNKVISMPVVDDDGIVKDELIFYKFNGEYFEIIGNR